MQLSRLDRVGSLIYTVMYVPVASRVLINVFSGGFSFPGQHPIVDVADNNNSDASKFILHNKWAANPRLNAA